MGRANYSVEQIIVKLREIEVSYNQGSTIAEVRYWVIIYLLLRLRYRACVSVYN